MPIMHGPAFTEKGELTERNVPDGDVNAYVTAGYKHGPLPVTPKAPAEPSEDVQGADLDSMSKAQLIEIAEGQGLETKGMNKADILELLKAS